MLSGRLRNSPLVRYQLPYLLGGWRRRLLGGGPLCLTFFVTSACNARCAHCLNAGRREAPGKLLTPDEVDRIAATTGPLMNLLISGGEPFLRPDLPELVEPFARRCGLRQVTVPTNGSMPERVEAGAASIARACPGAKTNIRVALDGPPALHDQIRDIEGGFELAMETVQRISRLGARHPNLWLELCFTLSRRNWNAYEPLLDELERRGVEQLPYIILCRPPTMEPDLWDVSPQQYDAAHQARRARLQQRSAGASRPQAMFHRVINAYMDTTRRQILRILQEPEFRWRCSAGSLSLVLDEGGEVYPCETSWQSLGNLRELDYDMRQVLRGEALRRFRQERKQGCRCTHETNVTLDSSLTLPALLSGVQSVFKQRSS